MLRCLSCGTSRPESERRWRCDCGGAMDYDWSTPPRFDRTRISSGPHSMWRYRDALPIAPATEPITMGEGLTPLVPRTWDGLNLRFKLDFMCPTGSYKDRGASVMITKFREAGIDAILEDSSGNAGAAVAAYAAAAGIRCTIYIPAYASAGKAAQIGAYGAELVRVPGTREDTTQAAMAAAETTFYATHNWLPWFIEGTKTVAFEIWEQSGWRAPDVVVSPAGYGSYLLGLYQGFSELLAAGQIDRLPRLVAVQSANCAPLVRALAAGLDDVPGIQKQETMAEGISCSQPVRGRRQVEAIRRSGGTAVAVSEAEIAQGLWSLARQGIYVEPTSATAAAALGHLRSSGFLTGSEDVVVCLTGSGLKATDKIVALMEKGM